MRKLLTVLAMAALAVAATTVASADSHFVDSAFDARLSGENEVPAVSTEGSGYVVVEVAEDGASIDYRLYATGMADVTMAHIHVGAEGENGPPVVFLFGPEDPGVMADGLLASGTIEEADLIEEPGVFDGTMSQLIALIEAGEAYVNVHTETNPAGEIRGQLSLAAFNFTAPLSGQDEVPAVDTDAVGLATLSLNPSQTALDFKVLTYGLEATTMSHIHVGAQGVNGPPVVFLFGPEDPGVDQDGLLSEGTITEEDLLEVPDLFDGTMQSLVDGLRAGTMYVNVHTESNPAGEIRGQVAGLERVPGGTAFTDDDDSVHQASIEVIAAAGITRGCNPPDNDEYCPEEHFTRGQAAAFFKRAFHLANSDADAFVDDDDSIFEQDIDAIFEVGITRGCNPPDNDRYCPDDPVTRAQWASFLVRGLQIAEPDAVDRFIDDSDSVHQADINSLAEAGITTGCNPPDNDEFCPDDPVTREQAATFVLRAFGWRALDS